MVGQVMGHPNLVSLCLMFPVRCASDTLQVHFRCFKCTSEYLGVYWVASAEHLEAAPRKPPAALLSETTIEDVKSSQTLQAHHSPTCKSTGCPLLHMKLADVAGGNIQSIYSLEGPRATERQGQEGWHVPGDVHDPGAVREGGPAEAAPGGQSSVRQRLHKVKVPSALLVSHVVSQLHLLQASMTSHITSIHHLQSVLLIALLLHI